MLIIIKRTFDFSLFIYSLVITKEYSVQLIGYNEINIGTKVAIR